MAAYGSVSVFGDYDGDIEAIANLLNEWDWDSECELKFVTLETIIKLRDLNNLFLGSLNPKLRDFNSPSLGRLNPTVSRVENPTVFPQRAWMVFGEGRRIRVTNDNQYSDDDYTWKNEELDIEVMRKEISKLMRCGTLHLVADGRENFDCYTERVTIHADGSAELMWLTFDGWNGEVIKKKSEEFPPLLAAQTKEKGHAGQCQPPNTSLLRN